MGIRNLGLVSLSLLSCAAFSPNSHAVFSEFLTHPNLEGVFTTDPYLGNADDGIAAGINPFGGASQFSFTNGTYGFLGGFMEVQSVTAFGLSNQLQFGLNQHNFVDMFGQWNFNPTSTFNQPFNQSLDDTSPTVINVNSDQTYSSSFVLNDVGGVNGRVEINGTGQYLLNSQTASDLYSGDVLTHFDTVVPLLPTDWVGVAQETQTLEVLDGAFAGLTGVASVTFFSFGSDFIPADTPIAPGPPWVTTGFAVDNNGTIHIGGGNPAPFFGIGGAGTGLLADGDTTSAQLLLIGAGGAGGQGEVSITGPGTMLTVNNLANVTNGSLYVTNGAKVFVDNASGTNPVGTGAEANAPGALLVVDGIGSEIKVSGGTASGIPGTEPEGVPPFNYAGPYNGGRMEVTNGGKVTVEGSNSSTIAVGGFGFTPEGTESTLLVEGQNSLVESDALIVVGEHPDVAALGFLQPDSGTLEIRDGGTAKANTIYIGANGTVTGHNGTLEGTVSNHGTIAPGDSPGILNIIGDYSQGADGKLIIEIAGTNPGEFDVLNISGSATLAGTLEIVLLDGFTPDESDTFNFLSPNSIIGAFDNFIFPVFGNNQTFALQSGPNGFTATVAPVPLPAGVWLFGSALVGLLWRRRQTG